MTNTLHIKNELKQLTRLYAFLDQQAGTYELGELQSMQIKLALEEAVTNVIQYAYPDKKDQDIRIDMKLREQTADNRHNRYRHQFQPSRKTGAGPYSLTGRTPDRRPRNLSGQATDDGSQL